MAYSRGDPDPNPELASLMFGAQIVLGYDKFLTEILMHLAETLLPRAAMRALARTCLRFSGLGFIVAAVRHLRVRAPIEDVEEACARKNRNRLHTQESNVGSHAPRNASGCPAGREVQPLQSKPHKRAKLPNPFACYGHTASR